MSSHARKLLPAEVLTHPSITSLVAAATPTPADTASASRLALAAALVLGCVALLVRVALPWVASRSG